MKEDALEYLDIEKIGKIIDKYNEFIQFPIYLLYAMSSTLITVAAH